ncbi:MAG: hypothetical protein JXR65_02110 [Bacteroidales bacterium]|nr:hypothetical protein [Bacteroidales bacterium]
MKTIKYIFLTTMGISLFLLTGCTMTQNLPYDDVYSSGSTPIPQQNTALQYTSSQPRQNSVYNEGNVQVVNLANNDTVQKNDTIQYSKEVVLIKNDTSQPSTNIYNYYSGLNFDNPYFGTGTYGWSMSSSYWGWGSTGYWNYPYSWYSPYYSSWGYPYYNSFYGWNSWYWGYPYSWYSPYTWNSPYYYGYYPSYYYPYSYNSNNVRYGHRNTSYLGGSLPRNALTGGYVPLKSSSYSRSRSSTPGTTVNTNPRLSNRSERVIENFKTDTKRSSVSNNERRSMYQKPDRGSNQTSVNNYQNRTREPRSEFKAGSQTNGISTIRPRYQKPRQYQSLDNRNPRSSKEYFRTQPNNLVRTVPANKTTRVTTNTPTRRFNVYRPENTRQVNQRPVYRTTTNSRPMYQPSRSVSPFKSTRTYTPNRNYSSPRTNNSSRPSNSSFSPSRTSTGSSGTGSSSGGSRSTGGGGGGSPHRR